MLEDFYPREKREEFTNRKRLLEEIKTSISLLKEKKGKHLAFIGLRKSGKTELLKYAICDIIKDDAIIPVHVDLEEIGLTPESFSRQYFGLICFWYLMRGEGPQEMFYNINNVIQEAAKQNNALIIETATEISRELEKERIDQRYLLELVLNFPERLAKETNKKFVVCMDEFQEILELSNFRQIRDITSLFRSVIQRQYNIRYLASGSVISLLERIFGDHASPLFGHFSLRYLEPFSREDTYELTGKLLKNKTKEILERIYLRSYGHPYYISCLCNRINSMDIRLTTSLVDKAFVIEVCSREGDIYKHCKYVFDVSLQRAKGYATLKTILLELAEKDGLTLTEISRKIKRRSGEVNIHLRRLMDVDFIIKRDLRYYFRDPVLKYWLLHNYRGIEVPSLPESRMVRDLVSELEERYQRTTTALGIAFESQIRELVRKFDGREISGRFFGIKGNLTLPIAKKVEQFVFKWGEIDALIQNKENWVLEVKKRGKSISIKDLQKLEENAKFLEREKAIKIDRLWFISSSFNEKAMDYALKQGIMVSDITNIRELSRLFNMRI